MNDTRAAVIHPVREGDGMWCQWCVNRRTGISPDVSAVTHVHVDATGAPDGWVAIRSHGTQLHLHEVAIVPLGGLTIRAAIKRHWAARRTRVVRRRNRIAGWLNGRLARG